MTTTDGISVDKLTKAFIRIRDRRNEMRREYEAQDRELSEQQDKIKHALLDYCKDQNVETVRTTEGTFYRTVRSKYWTSDWESMHKFVLENEAPELLEKRINQTAMREFLEEHPDVAPKGLNVEAVYSVSVRKPTK